LAKSCIAASLAPKSPVVGCNAFDLKLKNIANTNIYWGGFGAVGLQILIASTPIH